MTDRQTATAAAFAILWIAALYLLSDCTPHDLTTHRGALTTCTDAGPDDIPQCQTSEGGWTPPADTPDVLLPSGAVYDDAGPEHLPPPSPSLGDRVCWRVDAPELYASAFLVSAVWMSTPWGDSWVMDNSGIPQRDDGVCPPYWVADVPDCWVDTVPPLDPKDNETCNTWPENPELRRLTWDPVNGVLVFFGDVPEVGPPPFGCDGLAPCSPGMRHECGPSGAGSVCTITGTHPDCSVVVEGFWPDGIPAVITAEVCP